MHLILVADYDDPVHPLTEEVCNSLRKQNVDLDDWNFMLFLPMELTEPSTEEKNVEVEYGRWETIKVDTIRPKDWAIGRMVENGYDAKWYSNIEFYGKVWALGVQHH